MVVLGSTLSISGVSAAELGTNCFPRLGLLNAPQGKLQLLLAGKSETSHRSERANAEQAITSEIRK